MGAVQDDSREREILERFAQSYGLPIKGYVADRDELTADLGKFAALEDHDFWEKGEEGEVYITVVGSPAFGNERVMTEFVTEGADSGEEVEIGADVEAI
jgi:hypothetical protein